MNGPILAGGVIWCVLAAIWLLALDKSNKARWMHFLHALLPLAAMAGYILLPPAWGLTTFLRDWLIAGVAIVVLLTLVWLVTLVTRNSGVMDVAYTPTAVLPAVTLMVLQGTYAPPAVLLIVLMVAWSARLVRHAAGTNLGHRGEQQPYASWRLKYAGRWWWWSFFQVFLLQGGIVWVWILPVVLALNAASSSLSAVQMVAALVWLTGFMFQSMADSQLARFKADPANKGKVLQTGVWSISRHPNYFGESLMWWGYFVFGLAHSYGLLGIAGAIYATWFMSKGSAAAMLDRHMLRTKSDYADYVRRVPGFVPFYKSPSDTQLLAWASKRNIQS